MEIGKLDHVNVRTKQLDTMIDWYTNIMGMRRGERPDFPFPGAWMYTGSVAAVHLVGIDDKPSVGSEVDLKLEHFAFSAKGNCPKVEEFFLSLERAIFIGVEVFNTLLQSYPTSSI